MRKFVLSLLIMLSFSVVSSAANGTAEKRETAKAFVIGEPTGVTDLAQAVLAKAEAATYAKKMETAPAVFGSKYNKVTKDVYGENVNTEPFSPPDINKRADYTKPYCNYDTAAKKQTPFRSARDSL